MSVSKGQELPKWKSKRVYVIFQALGHKKRQKSIICPIFKFGLKFIWYPFSYTTMIIVDRKRQLNRKSLQLKKFLYKPLYKMILASFVWKFLLKKQNSFPRLN